MFQIMEPKREAKQRLPNAAGFLLLVAAFVTLACGTLTDPFGLVPTPTDAPIPTATPVGDFIVFDVPRYSVTLLPGDRVPATQLVYNQPGQDGYEFFVDGYLKPTQENNLLTWLGVVGPGVTGLYQLVVGAQGEDAVLATGSVQLTVLNPVPIADSNQSPTSDFIEFREIDIEYHVPKEGFVPGTSLVYEGIFAATSEAQFSGTNSDAYFRYSQNDVVIWRGQLRSTVLIEYRFRVVEYSDSSLVLDGLATLWVKPTK